MVTYSDGTVEQGQEYQSKPAPAKAGVKTMISLLQRVRARASGGWPSAVAERKTAEKTLLASQTSQGRAFLCEVKRRTSMGKATPSGSVLRCRSGAAGGIFRMSKSDPILAGQILHCKRAEQQSRCAAEPCHRMAVASNDNDLWRVAAFHLMQGMAA